ncbi:two-component regulator propeller domain-containing protein [Olivibacter sp. CPCC 100613]|uniref:ligand-binding sensor domain-containing protein n=1 Tax=Olivibacter sp. CPCC 100613 TaxID=3079931 RepID=UPI002FF57FA9
MIKKLITVFLFCLCVKQLYCQPYYFKHYQVENGLSNNAVICSMQDSKGFMWFGTRDGLNRFDGYTFKVFNHNPQDSLSLGNNFVHSLFEDRIGNIWVGTDLGIYIYDPLTEKFNHFIHHQDAAIAHIQADKKGNIWYTAFSSLVCYNTSSGGIRNFGKLGMSSVDAVSLSQKGVWVGSSNGEIKLLDPASGSTKSFEVFEKKTSIGSRPVTCLLWDDGAERLWIGTAKQGIKLLHPNEGTYQDLLGKSEDQLPIYVHDIKKTDRGQYMVATELGVFIYEDQYKRFVHLKKEDNNQWSISDNAVYTICRDAEGGIWIGSWFGGVSYYHKQHTFFEKFFPQKGENSLIGSAVREITADDYGNLWIGTENGGLNKLSLVNGRFEHFSVEGKRQTLSSSNIHGLLATGDTLWVGTFHQGLNLMRISTGEVFRQYTASEEPFQLGSNFIYTMLRVRSGEVLLATDRGIYQYLFEKDGFQLMRNFPSNIFYTSLFEDQDGTVWAGSWRDGLYYYNPKTGRKGRYSHQPGKVSTLTSNRVTYITETKDRRLWVATEEGLCRLEKLSGEFKRYHFPKSMQSLLVCTVQEDDQENLWISTSKGLIRFNPRTNTSRFFGVANGLLSDQFNYNAAYKARNGMLYFGTVKGLIRFNPRRLQDKSFVPPIYFTGFQVYNKDLAIDQNGSPLKKSITFTDTIILRHNQSTFSIDFAALSYPSPEMTEYVYRMDGLDPGWTYLQANRKAYFTELPPGEYIFRVSTVNSLGTRIGKEAVLAIHILPPFWASKAAYLLYAIFIIILVYYLINSYHLRLREKNRLKLEQLAHKKEEEMYRAKIEFFTQVAHEIRTPLTLIKGPMEKIIKQVNEVPAIRKNLLIMEKNTNRLLELSGQLLDFRKTEEQAFVLMYQRLEVVQFLKDQVERLGPTAMELRIKIKLDVLKEGLWVYVDVEALDKMLSNLLNNALKYAISKIVIRLQKEDRFFRIIIASDGEQIPTHLQEKIFEPFYRVKGNTKSIGSGLGLALARSLAEMHRGSLILDTENNENFNTFVLSLPCNQKESDL